MKESRVGATALLLANVTMMAMLVLMLNMMAAMVRVVAVVVMYVMPPATATPPRRLPNHNP